MTHAIATPESALRNQIAWTRLISICEEQARTLVRTSFSAIVREAEDLSAGIFDVEGRMLAQAQTGTPGHVNSMANAVGSFLLEYPAHTISPGDCFVTNDPWIASGHLHDFTSLTPVFRDGRLVAFFSSTIHVVDVGGIGLGVEGRQVYEEGVRIPIMKLFSKGVLNEDLRKVVSANCRTPRETVGDLFSQAAAGDEGGRRLLSMMDELGLEDLQALSEYIISTSRAAVQARIREMPEGSWHSTIQFDGIDEPIRGQGCLTIRDGEIHLDLAGSSPPSIYGINVVLNYTVAYASYGIRYLVAPVIPNNHGSLSPIHVTAPENTIFNVQPPAPVAARHLTGHMLPDLVLGCLRQALKTGVPAESNVLWNPEFRSISTEDDGTWQIYIFISPGMGARSGKDGLSACSFPGSVKSIAVEVIESITPLVVWQKELRMDSGGAGRQRGGLGQSFRVAHVQGKPFRVSAMFDRIESAARGDAQGGDGAKGTLHLASGGPIRGKGVQVVPRDDMLCLELPGGGGHGDPRLRSRHLVDSDVALGYVSERMAALQYGRN